jgi:PHD/YefM family antitoxin component YafN of YafNO toxin-antitoxin module
MIDTTQDTHPLEAFRDHPAEMIEQLKSNRRPIILTVDGQPQAVLQDPAEYQRLLDLAAQADPEEGLRQGLEDIAEGRTRPAREVFAELRDEYGIRG